MHVLSSKLGQLGIVCISEQNRRILVVRRTAPPSQHRRHLIRMGGPSVAVLPRKHVAFGRGCANPPSLLEGETDKHLFLESNEVIRRHKVQRARTLVHER